MDDPAPDADSAAAPALPGDLTFLRDDDARAIASLVAQTEVLQVHPNESHWWNHGSFLIPMIGFVASVAAGALFGSAELLGFGAFLGVVALLMIPVVLLTWRQTATAIVLTADGALALHGGSVLRELPWADVRAIDRVETQGNVRWKLRPATGQHLTVDGEIADVPGLVERARELAGLTEQPRPAAPR